MSFERSYRDQFNFSKKIPLHFQKRYLANISNASFNATFVTGVYKNKIKALLKNNKLLAVGLQNERTKKEELLAESKANADFIMFSRLKLASMSDHLKKVVSSLDETLTLLQMHSSVDIAKFIPKNTICREEFKEQLKEVSMEPIMEENEPSPCNKKIVSKISKGASAQVCGEAFSIPYDMACTDVQKSPDARFSKSISVTKNLKFNKLTNGQNSELSKEMLRKNSPLKEISPKTESNNKKKAKNCLASASIKKKKSFISNTTNTQKMSLPLSIKSSSENETLPLEMQNGGKYQFNETAVVKSRKKAHKVKATNELKEECRSLEKSNGEKKKDINDTSLKSTTRRNLRSKTKTFKNLRNLKSLDVVSKRNVDSILQHSNSDVLIDDVKENSNPKCDSELPRKKVKLFQHAVEPNFKNTNTSKRKTVLKNLSSEINIQNSNKRIKCKNEVYPLDDLSLDNSTNKKISYQYHILSDTKSLVTNKWKSENIYPPAEIDSKTSDSKTPKIESNLQCQGEEMVKNLAKNTYLVTAEVHRRPEKLASVEEIKQHSTDCVHSMQPIVSVRDIFKSSKLICNSISSPTNIDEKGVPLEIQLLKHCSSLKLITDEDNDKDNNCKSLEEPSTDVGKLEGRKFRKRPSQICYKEQSSNTKMRR